MYAVDMTLQCDAKFQNISILVKFSNFRLVFGENDNSHISVT